MSTSSPPMKDISASNLHLILDEAFAQYRQLTGHELTAHPLAANFENWGSIDTVLDVFQDQSRKFSEFRKGNERLMEWLKPTVEVLVSVSASLGNALSTPFPPAKAVFTGISILLSAAAGVAASYDVLVSLFDSVRYFLLRLKIYTGIPPTAELTEILGKIMAEIIFILALGTKEMMRGSIKKFLKRLAGKTEIEGALKKLDNFTQEEARMVGARNLGVAYVLENKVEVIRKETKMIADLQSREIIRNWIAAPNFSINHDNARAALSNGIGTWFIQGDAYKEWKTRRSLLWIRGIPGSGKTVLCSTIIEDLRRTGSPSALVAFFYFDPKDDAKRHIRALLSSILVQLCNKSNDCWGILSQLHADHNEGSDVPSEDTLAGFLIHTLNLLQEVTVYLVMDALDECPNTSGTPSPREKVLRLVGNLIKARDSNLHICVTSGLEQDIRSVLEPLTTMPLLVTLHEESGHKKAIIDYINSFVQSDREMGDWGAADRYLVIESLSRRTGGMFGWAACQLDTLRRSDPDGIVNALAELPSALDNTYLRALEKIPEEKRKRAHFIFQCLIATGRPLHVEELVGILALQFGQAALPKPEKGRHRNNAEDAAFAACSGLIIVVKDGDSQVVRFSHFSVGQFLTFPRLSASKDRKLCQYHVPLEPAHTNLAQACLTVLLQLNDKVDDQRMGDPPLALYAAQHWDFHARFGEVASQPQIQQDMERLFDPNKPHFRAWVRLHDLDQEGTRTTSNIREHPWQPTGTPLYYAVLCGLPSLVKNLIANLSQDINARGGYHGTPLHAALRKNDLSIAELFLAHGASVDARDQLNWRPLEKVLDDDHIEALRLLLKHKANVNALDQCQFTPLRRAAANGQLQVVRVLLQNGAQVNVADALAWTPLHLASFNGHVNVTQLLLENGANVNAQTKGGFTPLYVASSRGLIDIVKVLLRYAADVRLRGIGNQTPLRVAFAQNHFKVAQLLSGNSEGW